MKILFAEFNFIRGSGNNPGIEKESFLIPDMNTFKIRMLNIYHKVKFLRDDG